MIHFLDVGQGDSTLIHIPPSTQMLVDCGKDSKGLAAVSRKQSYFDRTIEYLVITHADFDHYAGCIDILNRYNIERIVYNGLGKNNDVYWDKFIKAINEEGSELIVLTDKRIWQFGVIAIESIFPDKDLRIVSPGFHTKKKTSNNFSIVLRVVAPNSTFLLTGDAEKEQEQYLADEYPDELNSTVLKVGHHGSKTSSIETFLERVKPSVGVISSGKDNKYGHPSQRVVSRLKRHGIKIRRTDLEDDISFVLY